MLLLTNVGIAVRCQAAIFSHETSLTESRDGSSNFTSRPGISRPVKKKIPSGPGLKPGTSTRDVSSRAHHYPPFFICATGSIPRHRLHTPIDYRLKFAISLASSYNIVSIRATSEPSATKTSPVLIHDFIHSLGSIVSSPYLLCVSEMNNMPLPNRPSELADIPGTLMLSAPISAKAGRASLGLSTQQLKALRECYHIAHARYNAKIGPCCQRRSGAGTGSAMQATGYVVCEDN
jgi:hypothetical protein